MTRRLTGVVVATALTLGGNALGQERAVALEVRSKSWIRNSAFDADRFRTECRDAGVELTPAGASAPRVHVVIEYEEKRGSGFSHFGVGNPEGWGTDITMAMSVAEAGKRPLFVLKLDAETPAGLEIEQFHQGARDALATSPGYRMACHAIGAALGSAADQRRLLPWAVFDERPLAILAATKFQPATASEEAYFAIARRDFDRVRALGEAASEPLVLLLDNSVDDRAGLGTFLADSPQRSTVLARAIDLLAALDDDERTVETLSAFINDYALIRDEQPAAAPALIAAIRTLADIGTRFTLPLLDQWAQGQGDISREAGRAAAAIRKRIEF